MSHLFSGNVPQLDNTTYDESGDISTDSPNDFHIKTEPEDTVGLYLFEFKGR